VKVPSRGSELKGRNFLGVPLFKTSFPNQKSWGNSTLFLGCKVSLAWFFFFFPSAPFRTPGKHAQVTVCSNDFKLCHMTELHMVYCVPKNQ
jgi:hypothetical protein